MSIYSYDHYLSLEEQSVGVETGEIPKEIPRHISYRQVLQIKLYTIKTIRCLIVKHMNSQSGWLTS